MKTATAVTIRALDVCLATTGILLGAPLLLLIWVIGYIDSGSPVFRQTRMGRNQTPFTLIKFRTMRIGTPSVATHEADAGSVTRIGAILRRTKLDEFPQLFNVLSGAMSLVGPRPCLPTQAELIREREQLGVFSVRPGITGLAQVRGIDMSEPRKLAHVDAEMIRGFNVTRYLSLLASTLTGSGQGDRITRNDPPNTRS